MQRKVAQIGVDRAMLDFIYRASDKFDCGGIRRESFLKSQVIGVILSAEAKLLQSEETHDTPPKKEVKEE